MPVYEVEYSCPLSQAQQAALANALIAIHFKYFHIPAAFVSIRFRDCSKEVVYVAGQVRPFNIVRTFARAGHPSDEMGRAGEEIYVAWKEIVGDEGEQELHVVLMLGCVSAALEYGMLAPGVAGTDKWVQEHMAEFRRRAEGGNEAFQGLVKGIEAQQSGAHTGSHGAEKHQYYGAGI